PNRIVPPTASSQRHPNGMDQYRESGTMAKGTVKWFNPTKGYGFIQPQSGGKDLFVHISAVERAGLSTLNEGQVVEYEEVSNKGKTSAENLRVQRLFRWGAPQPIIAASLRRRVFAFCQVPSVHWHKNGMTYVPT